MLRLWEPIPFLLGKSLTILWDTALPDSVPMVQEGRTQPHALSQGQERTKPSVPGEGCSSGKSPRCCTLEPAPGAERRQGKTGPQARLANQTGALGNYNLEEINEEPVLEDPYMWKFSEQKK